MATSFDDLSQRQQWMVVGLLCVAAAFIFYTQVWRGNASEIEQLESQIQQLELEVREMQAYAEQLPDLQQELEVLRTRLEVLRHILPEEYETDALLRGVGTLAAQSNLDIRDLEFRDPVPHEFYAESPIELELTGGYHDLARFFDRIGKFARIINIDEVDIEAESEGSDTVRASVTAVTFIFLEEEAAQGEEQEEGGTSS